MDFNYLEKISLCNRARGYIPLVLKREEIFFKWIADVLDIYMV
jgi:hypothetical protein